MSRHKGNVQNELQQNGATTLSVKTLSITMFRIVKKCDILPNVIISIMASAALLNEVCYGRKHQLKVKA